MASGPTAEEHRKRAQHNENFARHLGGAKTKWRSWVMTAIFYSALHHLQAFLIEQGYRPEEHADRNDLLRQWPELRRPYMRLYQWSRDARYDCIEHPENRLSDALLLLEDIKQEIAALRS